MSKMSRKRVAFYLQNFIFGVEDSLVSTVGMLSGIAIAQVSRSVIVLSGVVLLFVEAFSMGVGSFLSKQSENDFLKGKFQNSRLTLVGGIIMFFSYFIAGFIPLFPYMIWDKTVSFPVSIIGSLLALFVLGAAGAGFSKTSYIKTGVRMLVMGGLAIALGVGVGAFVNHYINLL